MSGLISNQGLNLLQNLEKLQKNTASNKKQIHHSHHKIHKEHSLDTKNKPNPEKKFISGSYSPTQTNFVSESQTKEKEITKNNPTNQKKEDRSNDDKSNSLKEKFSKYLSANHQCDQKGKNISKDIERKPIIKEHKNYSSEPNVSKPKEKVKTEMDIICDKILNMTTDELEKFKKENKNYPKYKEYMNKHYFNDGKEHKDTHKNVEIKKKIPAPNLKDKKKEKEKEHHISQRTAYERNLIKDLSKGQTRMDPNFKAKKHIEKHENIHKNDIISNISKKLDAFKSQIKENKFLGKKRDMEDKKYQEILRKFEELQNEVNEVKNMNKKNDKLKETKENNQNSSTNSISITKNQPSEKNVKVKTKEDFFRELKEKNRIQNQIDGKKNEKPVVKKKPKMNKLDAEFLDSECDDFIDDEEEEENDSEDNIKVYNFLRKVDAVNRKRKELYGNDNGDIPEDGYEATQLMEQRTLEIGKRTDKLLKKYDEEKNEHKFK